MLPGGCLVLVAVAIKRLFLASAAESVYLRAREGISNNR